MGQRPCGKKRAYSAGFCGRHTRRTTTRSGGGLGGGKLLLLGVEKLRGKPLPPEKEGVMNMIALGLFMALFVVLTFRDVGRIIGG